MSTAIETQDERDEQVAEAITNGRSLRAVRREFGLSQAELDAALERLWPVSTEARIRMIKHDVGCLQRLTQVFYEKAIAGCIQSGLLTVRIYERLHSLVGADAAQRIDFQVVRPPDAISSHEKTERQPPAEREAHNLIGKIGGERALELLRAGEAGNGNGNGAAVPPADDTEPR